MSDEMDKELETPEVSEAAEATPELAPEAPSEEQTS